VGPQVDPVEQVNVRDHAFLPPEVAPPPHHDPKRQHAALTRAGDRVRAAAGNLRGVIVVEPPAAEVLKGV
jgi:hypothetical protein